MGSSFTHAALLATLGALRPACALEPATADEALAVFQGRFSSPESLGSLFDGSGTRPRLDRTALLARRGAERKGTVVDEGLERYRRLVEVRSLLSHGTRQPGGGQVRPFVFHPHGGPVTSAQTAGLEGFVHAEAELSRVLGRPALIHHVEHYFDYLDALLAPVPSAEKARAELRALRASRLPPEEAYAKVVSWAGRQAAALRRDASRLDEAAWVRSARIYEIFPRAYNARGRRPGPDTGRFFADFDSGDLALIRDMGFDTLWVMGIFPIGRRNAFGTAGGSPYSVSDHEAVHPALGTIEEFRAFVERAHAAGLRVIIDFIPNHTSMDSRLLMERPDYFIHTAADPARPRPPPRGFFDHMDPRSGRWLWVRHGGYDSYGSLAFWEDTAQVDYSNPELRREMARIVSGWVERAGVDGFRVDMAYQVLNSYFSRNWGLRMPEREFLEEMITSVKARHPGVAFIAEGYDGWDGLSESGFDLIYSKNEVGRPGGHQGWYDALASRDPGRIRQAVSRAAFLRWQSGGAAALNFAGNHDEASPRRAFGPWMRGAAFLTLMMPGGLLFYGSQEIGFDRPAPGEPKSLPFSVPVSVDWSAGDPESAAFFPGAFAAARRLRERLGTSPEISPVGEGPWAGFLLRAAAPPAGRAPGDSRGARAPPEAGAGTVAVVANPTGSPAEVVIDRPDWGFEWRGTLEPHGYALID